MAKKSVRKEYTDAFKKRAVARVVNKSGKEKGTSLLVEATTLGISDATLRNWARKPKYGGAPGAFTNKKKGTLGIPQEKAQVDHRKPRDLVATKFGCPWCGGPIKKE